MIVHKIVFSVDILTDIVLFQSLNHQEGNLKFLNKSGYYYFF